MYTGRRWYSAAVMSRSVSAMQFSGVMTVRAQTAGAVIW
jgi:hypothetical protein